MTRTSIEWTRGEDGSAGETWNPVRGCSRVSPGCGGPNHKGGCYAEKIAARFSDPGQAFHGFAKRTPHGGRWTGKLALVDEKLLEPLSWRKPRRVFVNSMSDLFHENLPDEAIDKVFAVMALCPQHTFMVLTKRLARMREYFLGREKFRDLHPLEDRYQAIDKAMDEVAPQHWCKRELQDYSEEGLPLPNVWLGVSTEQQKEADERIPLLLDTPAAKRFISAEPLLGPIDLRGGGECTEVGHIDWLKGFDGSDPKIPGLDWVIVGGESGPNSRPMHPKWAQSLHDQCKQSGVPFFLKQWGAWLPIPEWTGHLGGGRFRTECAILPDGSPCPHDVNPDDVGGHRFALVGKKAAGRLLDGREHQEWPR